MKLSRILYLAGMQETGQLLRESKSIEFTLDIAIDFEEVKEILKKAGLSGTIVRYSDQPMPMVYFNAANDKEANDIVDALYGEEDDTRDSNKFFIYGIEEEMAVDDDDADYVDRCVDDVDDDVDDDADSKAERAIKELSEHLRGLDAAMADLIDLDDNADMSDDMNMMVDEIVVEYKSMVDALEDLTKSLGDYY